MSKPRYRPTDEGDWQRVRAAGKGFAARVVELEDDDDYSPPGLHNAPWNRDEGPGRRLTAPDAPGAGALMFDEGSLQTRYTGAASTQRRGGFANFGDFAKLVKIASNPEPGVEAARAAERLRNAALSTYGSEGVGADGGFAVPPEFVETIMSKVFAEESLLGLCDVIPTAASSVALPKDETSPWGATGIKGYWDGEAATMTQSKPVLENSTIKLNKLTALVPITDELVEDAPALMTWLPKKAAEMIDFRITDAIVNGTGVGQPLGILNAAHTVSQAKETSQVAATIHGKNLVKMWTRMPAAWRRRAVWLVHPDAEPELMQAGLQIGPADSGAKTGGQLIWMPAGSIADSPYATLFGRPVIPSQACAALGTVGDIIFAAFQQYGMFIRSPGLRSEASIHLWFDQGVTAFRFTFRLGGQPWWSAPIADKNGNGTRSAFVTLATRS